MLVKPNRWRSTEMAVIYDDRVKENRWDPDRQTQVGERNRMAREEVGQRETFKTEKNNSQDVSYKAVTTSYRFNSI